jgi:hypothetical protein
LLNNIYSYDAEANKVIISTTGPQGPTGPTGPQGLTGPQGPTASYTASAGYAASANYANIITSASGIPTRWYGSFYDTTTQSAGSTASAYAMTFNTTDTSNGISIVSGSQVKFNNTGIYNIQFSAQLQRSNSGTDTVEIWPGINGTSVPWSNTIISITGAANANPTVAAWNFILSVSAGQYFSLYWRTSDTHVTIATSASSTAPNRPAIPSVILTAVQV